MAGSTIEHMFEGMSEADLVEVMGEATRDESSAIALRLLATAELYARRAEEMAERVFWVADPTEEVAAEVSAVQNISRSRAVGQVRYARVLRERLPQVAKVFLRGTIDIRLVSTIIARTENVSAELMPELDAMLAGRCEKWMKLSYPKLRDRIDQYVASLDPEGVRVPPQADERRFMQTESGPAPGLATVWGVVRSEDAAAYDKRLDAIADTVCENDPRGRQQRRADAVGALGRGETTLACECGRPDCAAAAARRDPSAGGVVIHVLAEQGTVDGTSDKPGYLPRFGVLPAESVRKLAQQATLKPLRIPTTAESGYRPGTALREFLWWRDLTCRWPGCDKPVEQCDIDHTVPWPLGPTHASNMKGLCRIHHIIKTFCGWSDRQLPDGTIVLTSPIGCTYSTEAHGAALFPALGLPTGELSPPAGATTDPEPGGCDRTAMMPRRKRTRDQERQVRIDAERQQRREIIAEEERQRQAWLAATYEPPPF